MKFGKSIIRVIELSDPEWGPYWINYKFLKKKIKEIVILNGGLKVSDPVLAGRPSELLKCISEVEFFQLLNKEMKKVSDFYLSTEKLYRIRKSRVWEGFSMLKEEGVIHDKNTWTRLLCACVKFYKDVLLLENYAIMNFCGFSKILKKHDKLTGFATREPFIRNVLSQQNFTHYTYALYLIKESEKLYAEIQGMESVMPLQDEERLFIAAMRDLNYRAGKVQEEEKDLHNSDSGSSKSVSPTFDKEPSESNLSGSATVTDGKRLVQNTGEELNTATMVAMEAASKLTSNPSSSSTLQSIISWTAQESSTSIGSSVKHSVKRPYPKVDNVDIDQQSVSDESECNQIRKRPHAIVG